jgi:hypothetical protein
MPSKIRKHIQNIHREIDGLLGHFLGGSPYLISLTDQAPGKLRPENFDGFTYSKLSHFQKFRMMPIYERQTQSACDLKVYQDLFVHTFILENIPTGARILEIGGGDSRVIAGLKDDYEFWNLDKLEGQGHGPKGGESEGFELVRDFIGTFSNALPDHYFDFVYSISAMEHFSTDQKALEDIVQDIKRLLRSGACSLHCVDALKFQDHLWAHPIIDMLSLRFDHVRVETDFDKISSDKDLWTIPKYAYYTRWFPITKRQISTFGRPFSLNLYWKTSS